MPGIPTSATYATPKGATKGKALALFFTDLPIGVWLQFMQSYVHQEFEAKLLTDDAFFDIVRQRLASPLS